MIKLENIYFTYEKNILDVGDKVNISLKLNTRDASINFLTDSLKVTRVAKVRGKGYRYFLTAGLYKKKLSNGEYKLQASV